MVAPSNASRETVAHRPCSRGTEVATDTAAKARSTVEGRVHQNHVAASVATRCERLVLTELVAVTRQVEPRRTCRTTRDTDTTTTSVEPNCAEYNKCGVYMGTTSKSPSPLTQISRGVKFFTGVCCGARGEVCRHSRSLYGSGKGSLKSPCRTFIGYQ